MARQQIPPVKYSSELLNSQFKFDQLIKNKKYQTAKLLKEKMEALVERENEEWELKFLAQREKQKELLRKKQTNEYEALKTRLEKSINTKLKMRMNDYDKLLQRIQNLQNELITKQTLQFSRIQSANAKILSKYDLNLSELANASITKDYSIGDLQGNRAGKGVRENQPEGKLGAAGGKRAPMKPIMEREENEILSDNRFKATVSSLESEVGGSASSGHPQIHRHDWGGWGGGPQTTSQKQPGEIRAPGAAGEGSGGRGPDFRGRPGSPDPPEPPPIRKRQQRKRLQLSRQTCWTERGSELAPGGSAGRAKGGATGRPRAHRHAP